MEQRVYAHPVGLRMKRFCIPRAQLRADDVYTFINKDLDSLFHTRVFTS